MLGVLNFFIIDKDGIKEKIDAEERDELYSREQQLTFDS
jgi:hypothetical protein